ncbi:MAG TPA: MFS transporter [Candidatus Saccharimonadales bacterium]|nr:MFS transporter [Candidatus Saccharimonadales bacterium]
MTRKPFLTLLVTIIGSGVVLLDGTVVNLALPALTKELGASFSQLQWIVDGFLLSLSALILLGGSLGDIFGRKKVYMFGLVGFGLASIACGLAPTPEFLIAMRVLQGVFGALVVPGGLAIINTNFTASDRSRAIGRWAAWSGIAAALGPLVGGYLIDALSWRWIFFINVPFIVVCLVLAAGNVQESVRATGRRVDIVGASLAMAFLAGITYGLIEGPASGWDGWSVGALVAGFVLLAAFVVVELKRRDPMVDLRLFKSRNFSGANIMTFAMYGALSGFFFALVLYLQNVLGYTSTMAGLVLLPVTLFLLFFSGKMGGLTDTFGPRIFMTIGPALAGLGMLLLLPLGPGANIFLHVLPGIVLFGIGLVLLVAPLTVTVMSSVDDAHSGIASGINNAVSRAAGLIVIALLGLLGSGSYQFSVGLCAALAFFAAAVSFLSIRNPKKRPQKV